MIVFPNAKINLGLHVLRRRTDGFHDLETVFYPVPLYDILEVILSGSSSHGKAYPAVSTGIQLETQVVVLKSGINISYSASGIPVGGSPGQNLCIQACELYDERFGIPGDLSIHLHKIIPMGAGLGGGSSDAAFMLKALDELAGFKAKRDEMLEMAAVLGSDCSFFIINSPVAASGRGEIMHPVKVALNGYKLVIVKPPVHVSTKVAFEGIQLNPSPVNITQVISEDISTWKTQLFNDFENSIIAEYPDLADIKKRLWNNGAVYVSMTGSGSAIYGLFKESVPHQKLFEGSFYFSGILTG